MVEEALCERSFAGTIIAEEGDVFDVVRIVDLHVGLRFRQSRGTEVAWSILNLLLVVIAYYCQVDLYFRAQITKKNRMGKFSTRKIVLRL